MSITPRHPHFRTHKQKPLPNLLKGELFMHVKEWIQFTAQSLVDDPKQVSVNAIEGARTTVFELSVAKSDVGKVIGKQGRTANSIRDVLNSIAAKNKRQFSLEIVE
jgi:predicted RNA-binding protein YlqC (UPF0109 family)